MTTQTEALKLALEALEIMESRFGSEMFRHEIQPSTFGCHHNSETCPLCNGLVTGWKAVRAANQAITAIKEALAQPEHKKCENCGEFGECCQEQPEQEPVGQLLEDAFGRGQVMWFNKPEDESLLYTTPPHSKPSKEDALYETFAKIAGYLEIDTEVARSAAGKPSDVFIEAIKKREAPQRKPLTDERIADIVIEMNGNEPTALFWRDLAQAIEAAHGIKE